MAEGVVGRRGGILVPPVAADEAVVRGAGRPGRPRSRTATGPIAERTHSASCRRPRDGGPRGRCTPSGRATGRRPRASSARAAPRGGRGRVRSAGEAATVITCAAGPTAGEPARAAPARGQSGAALPRRRRRRPRRERAVGCERGEYARNHMAATRRCRPDRRGCRRRAGRAARRRLSPPCLDVTAADLRTPTAPAARSPPSQLRLRPAAYWGFDGAAAPRPLVVNAAVVRAVERVFARLYARASRSGGCSRSTPTAAATTARWRPTTPRPSTAATPSRPGRGAGRCTPTARRSTSTRSRTRTSTAGASCRPQGAAYLDRVARPAGDGGRRAARSSRAFAAVGWQWGGRLDGLARLPALLGDRRLRGRGESRPVACRLTSVRRFRLHRRARWPRPPEGRPASRALRVRPPARPLA